MTVRAKLKCFAVDRLNSGNPEERVAEIRFFVDYSADDETNKSWSKATPSASLSMFVSNPDAIDAFEPGKHYYLDFTLAE